jgi:hypothetical protein
MKNNFQVAATFAHDINLFTWLWKGLTTNQILFHHIPKYIKLLEIAIVKIMDQWRINTLSTLKVLWNQSWEIGSPPIWIWWSIRFLSTSTYLKISLMILPSKNGTCCLHNMKMMHNLKLWFCENFTNLGKLHLESCYDLLVRIKWLLLW